MFSLSESIGSYSQTIRVFSRHNEVKVSRNGQILYEGKATHVVDKDNLLTFKDEQGNQHGYIKYARVYIS